MCHPSIGKIISNWDTSKSRTPEKHLAYVSGRVSNSGIETIDPTVV
jgi:hypothetical protein